MATRLGHEFGLPYPSLSLSSPWQGLSTAEVEKRQEIFGLNMLPEKHINPILQFLSFMWNPLSWYAGKKV